MKIAIFAVALTAFSGAALANGIEVTDVIGSGSVTSGTQSAAAAAKMQLTENATVTATKGSLVTIKFPSGCVAKVTAAEPFVASEANCRALVAKGWATPAVPRTFSFNGPTVAALGGGLLGLAILADNSKSISPN